MPNYVFFEQMSQIINFDEICDIEVFLCLNLSLHSTYSTIFEAGFNKSSIEPVSRQRPMTWIALCCCLKMIRIA